MTTRLRAWLRAIFATRPVPPVDRCYAWRDARPDGLYQAHRNVPGRSAGAAPDWSPPVSSPRSEPIDWLRHVATPETVHYHDGDHAACFTDHGPL